MKKGTTDTFPGKKPLWKKRTKTLLFFKSTRYVGWLYKCMNAFPCFDKIINLSLNGA